MDQQQIIARIEERAKALSIPVSRVCTEAGIHPTTFSRWKLSERNPAPIGASLRSLSALDAALCAMEKAAPRRKRVAA